MLKMKTINIALAQLRPTLYEKEINLLRMLQSIEEASDKGADYILFPELYLTGYVTDENLLTLAEHENGPSILKLREKSKEFATGAIVGFPEKEGKKIYNTALFIGKNGEIIGKYRKVHLYHKEKDWFTAGNSFPVFEIEEGRIGLGITYDMEFPEAVRSVALQGAQLLLVLAANMIPYQNFQDTFIKARALENHMYTAVSNMVGLDSENVFFGESQVVHPSGTVIYKGKNNEEIPVLELKLHETAPEKEILDYLHNRKTDIYIR